MITACGTVWISPVEYFRFVIPYATSWSKPLWNVKSKKCSHFPISSRALWIDFILVTGYLQKFDARNELHQLSSLSSENHPSVLVLKIAVKPLKGQLFPKLITWIINTFHGFQIFINDIFKKAFINRENVEKTWRLTRSHCFRKLCFEGCFGFLIIILYTFNRIIT